MFHCIVKCFTAYDTLLFYFIVLLTVNGSTTTSTNQHTLRICYKLTESESAATVQLSHTVHISTIFCVMWTGYIQLYILDVFITSAFHTSYKNEFLVIAQT